ncbi:MAG: hypothetical protein QOH23_1691 [Gaiellaceae bacterium]|jgi:hypothetical protein|nr:hypothetical protein [Gaiellaceae bacterium]
MKSLTTRLAERAMSKQEMPQDPLAPMRDAAAAQLGAPVLDAALFTRQSNDAAKRVAGSATFGGPLARMALGKFEQTRAGGLPKHFLLAVTTDDVIALERTLGTRSTDAAGEPGAEVARWRRADLEVSVQEKGYMLNVTLASPSEDEKVECAVTKITATQDFVALLGDASRQTPAQQFPDAG